MRQTHQGSASLTTAKIDGIRDELDEASYRVQQCRVSGAVGCVHTEYSSVG